jgi:hypothetical protein
MVMVNGSDSLPEVAILERATDRREGSTSVKDPQPWQVYQVIGVPQVWLVVDNQGKEWLVPIERNRAVWEKRHPFPGTGGSPPIAGIARGARLDRDTEMQMLREMRRGAPH